MTSRKLLVPATLWLCTFLAGPAHAHTVWGGTTTNSGSGFIDMWANAGDDFATPRYQWLTITSSHAMALTRWNPPCLAVIKQDLIYEGEIVNSDSRLLVATDAGYDYREVDLNALVWVGGHSIYYFFASTWYEGPNANYYVDDGLHEIWTF